MGITKINNKNAVVCDVCGSVISFEVDGNTRHGYVCTNCIDIDFGKFRVMDLHRYDLDALKYKPDKLSDDIMAEVAKQMTAEYLSGPYWTDLKLVAERLALEGK